MRLSIFFLFAFYALCCNDSAKPSESITMAVGQEPEDSISFTLDWIMGKFDPASDTNFISADVKYCDREGLFLHKKTYAAFIKMWQAAKEDSISLVIRSATRNFDYQKSIWEKKWLGKTILSNGKNALKEYPSEQVRALKILEYSSMPGTSRHHWGTDIDLNSFDNHWFDSGEGKKLYAWMTENASKFGFCQTYTEKDSLRPTGYNEEKWHWSYFPLSSKFTSFAEQNLKDSLLVGFLGHSVCQELSIVSNYVLGINPDCK